MQLKRLVFYVLFFLCLAAKSRAQKDSVHLIDQVIISAEVRVIHLHHGLKYERLDSTILANSLNFSAAEILNRMSSVYIKSYGGSGLASSSFRGGSANHTAIIWNGFNLQSPVTGMMDLSLIPAGLFNQITLQYGGKSTIWGSGAVGGAIHFGNKTPFNQDASFQLYAGAGSFNEKNVIASANYSNANFSNSTKLLHTDAENNFTYRMPSSDSLLTRKMPHAASQQKTLLQDNSFKLKNNQLVETHLWLQQNKREIPPTLFQLNSDAFQEDRAIRIAAGYHKYFKAWHLNIRSAYFNEALFYKENEFAEASQNKSQTYINEIMLDKTIGRHIWVMGFNNTHAQSQSAEFIFNNPFQNRTALFSSFQYLHRNGNLSAVAGARKEWVNTGEAPLTWSLGVDYYIFQWFKLKAGASRIYRLPTLNDLFWRAGGNQKLLPEDGYSFEGGGMLLLPKNPKHCTFNIEGTAFSRIMNNWIIWLPNGNFWSPQNLMRVWSRGTEMSFNYTLKSKQLHLLSSLKTSYVLSENTASKLQDDASLNKQLIYVPMYSGQLNYGFTFKQLTVLMNHTYTGYRYTASDHSGYLEPFFLHHLNMAYKLSFKKLSVDIQFQINNLLNTTYMALASRAMPGISFRGGLVFNFISNNGKLSN
jgi:iron complex outermembrane receptor protein